VGRLSDLDVSECFALVRALACACVWDVMCVHTRANLREAGSRDEAHAKVAARLGHLNGFLGVVARC